MFDSTVYVNREGDFTRADIFSVDEVEIFEGRENRITMVQTYSKKFHCTYLLHNYPFDTQVNKPRITFLSHRGQVCYIHMILKKFDQNTARLIPNIIEMESELELSTYTISEWDLVHFEDGKTKHNTERALEGIKVFLPDDDNQGFCYQQDPSKY